MDVILYLIFKFVSLFWFFGNVVRESRKKEIEFVVFGKGVRGIEEKGDD